MSCKPLVGLAAALAAIAVTHEARAGTELAADLDGAGVLSGNDRLFSSAYGIGARVGYEASLAIIRLTPEVGYAYMRFSADRAPADWRSSRVFVGGRVGLGGIIVPSVFAHVGYGWVDAVDGAYTGSGDTLDIGVALDLRLAVFGAGVHAAYNTLSSDHPQQWINVGVHGEIVF